MTRTVYEIRDVLGEVIAEHVRVDRPDGSKSMFWKVPGCDPRDGLMGIGTADLPLYGSQYIPFWQAGDTVVVCEGERATDTVFALGIPALGTVTGASSTPGEDALSVLLPFDVVLWPDNDKPGQAHMARVAASLRRLGGSARRLSWGAEKGDDAADFVARPAGPSHRALLDVLIRTAKPWRVEDPEVAHPIPRARYMDYGDGDVRVARARGHLVEVVEAKLGPPKRKDSRSLFWPCPFHAGDRDPSFKVDLKEPFYRCFGCEARGDVFTFLRAMEGIEFKDALAELAPPRLLGAAIPW